MWTLTLRSPLPSLLLGSLALWLGVSLASYSVSVACSSSALWVACLASFLGMLRILMVDTTP
jgi:hypothetical protein